MNGFWSIARKEMIHIRRDRTTLIFAVVVPILQMMLFGYAIDFQVRHVPAVAVDQDRSRESRAYLAQVANTNFVDIVAYANSPDEASDRVRRGRVRAAIIIPPDFSARYGTANPPQVRVLLDGSDIQVSNAVRSAFARPPDPSTQLAITQLSVLYNPNAKTYIFTVPGLIGVIMQLVIVTLASFSLVRERESGTLDQVMVTPVGRWGLILGKVLPYGALAFVEFAGALAVAWLLFDVPIRGSLLLLTVLAGLFAMAALAMGILISTVARSQAVAMQFALLTMLPSILLSGYIAPRETLPPFLSVISNAFPVTHFIEIARAIMVRGAGFWDVLPSALWLLGIAGGLLMLAASRIAKTIG